MAPSFSVVGRDYIWGPTDHSPFLTGPPPWSLSVVLVFLADTSTRRTVMYPNGVETSIRNREDSRISLWFTALLPNAFLGKRVLVGLWKG